MLQSSLHAASSVEERQKKKVAIDGSKELEFQHYSTQKIRSLVFPSLVSRKLRTEKNTDVLTLGHFVVLPQTS